MDTHDQRGELIRSQPPPDPLEQPEDCSFGGDLVMTFEDGSELRYGPCRRPASINQLWAAMIYAIDKGDCVPSCGPGGTFWPFEYVLHVPKPDNIGEPDWGNSIIQSAWERSCAEDLDKDGFRWSGRDFHVSDWGMMVTVQCDDGSAHLVKVVFDPV